MPTITITVQTSASTNFDGGAEDPFTGIAEGDEADSATSDTIVIPHFGFGREYVVQGSGFTFDGVTGEPTGGSISSLVIRTLADSPIATMTTDTPFSLVAMVNAVDADDEGALDALIDPYMFIFNGNIGNDLVNGADQGDSIMGGDGADTLGGEFGNDSVFGGAGADSIIAGGGADFVRGNTGNDTMRGGADSDDIRGGGDNDEMYGGSSGDFIAGALGADFLRGALGDDTLGGGQGDDIVGGGQGSDQLRGGQGHDELTGGLGADDFVFANAGAADSDFVFGFSIVEDDNIVLDSAFFTQVGAAGGLDAAKFLAASTVSGTNGAGVRILYDTDSGDIFYDADGGSASNAQLIATLDNLAALTADDFGVI